MSKFGKWNVGSLSKAQTQEAYDAILKTIPRKFLGAGNTLADFGYYYNEKLQLRQISNNEPFAWLGQKHYDHLGEAIVEKIYSIMEDKYGLRRIVLPFGPDSDKNPRSTPENPRAPIFVSPNASTAETLVVLCQGIG